MHRTLVAVWLAAQCVRPGAGTRGGAGKAAGKRASFRHPVDRRQAWRLLELGDADGTRMGRESMNLRGQVFELDSSGKAGADGMPSTITIRGVTPQGDAGRDLRRSAAGRRVEEPGRCRQRELFGSGVLRSQGGPIDTTAWFLEALLARPDKSLDLLPGGKARAAKLTDLEVGTGAARQTITLWAVTGISTSPLPIWADANNKFFGLTFGLAWLPEAYAGEQSKIEEAQATGDGGAGAGVGQSRWSRHLRDRLRSPASGSSTPTQRGS